MLIGHCDYRLVSLSILIAVLSSYTALDLAGRVTSTRGGEHPWWLVGGGFAMGVGIWAMQFTGKLAFSLPIPIYYPWPTTLLALGIAVMGTRP